MLRLAFLSGISLALLSCSSNAREDAPAAAATPVAAASDLVGRMRATYVIASDGERAALVPESVATSFARQGDRLLADRGANARAKLALPTSADRPFSLANDGVTIQVRPLGARAVPAQIEGGALVYPAAFEKGTLAHVPLIDGTEELIELHERADERTDRVLRWELGLGDGAAALRVVSDVVEVLDARGVPRLHVPAPTVVDRAGHAVRGTIDVEGCAVDRDPRMPQDRPIVAPGARTCHVVARFSDEGLSYPLLVDPAWTTTGSLAAGRARHEVVAYKTSSGTCSSGCVIAIGGHNAAVLSSAEIYAESTGTWSATGSMGVARHSFAAVLYYNSRIVVAGGGTTVPPGTGATAWTEQFDPSTGGWTGIGNLPGGARMGLAGAYVTSSVMLAAPLVGTRAVGQAIFSGGFTGAGYSNKVDLYLDSDLGDATAPSLVAWTSLTTPRAYHAQGAWDSGCGISFCTSRRVFVVAGGLTTGAAATGSVEWVNGSYSTTPPSAWAAAGSLGDARYGVGFTTWGAWHWIAGGWTGASSRSSEVSLFNMSSGSLTKIGDLKLARGDIAAAATGGKALLIGGSTSATGLNQGAADVEAASSTTMTAVSPLAQRRTHHRAARLSSGGVLAVGGLYSGSIISNAVYPTTVELYGALDNGQTCGAAGDCKSGQCVDGVCCDSACGGQCQACNLPSALGTCTTVTKSNGPAGYPAGQAVTGFGTTRPLCAPFGEPCGFACDGSSATACTLRSPRPTCITASCTGGVQTNPATCDALGYCPTPTPATTSCAEYSCGATACLTSCTADANCATGYKCDTVSAKCIPSGDAGAPCTTAAQCKTGLGCVDGVCCSSLSCPSGMVCNTTKAPGQCKLQEGKACTTAAECGSGFCVDGVCCASLCTGQCEACDVPGAEGTCAPVAGAPHGKRTACSDGGGDACKKLACDGSDRTKCLTYANGLDTVCQPATCTNGTLGAEGVCDGKGSCKVGESKSCAPYACDGATRCKTTCATQADCAPGYNCASGNCTAVTAKCSDDRTTSVALDGSGATKACAPYACDTSSGNCFDKCSTTADCATSAVCDGDKCVAAPAAAEGDDGGCAIGAPAPTRIGGAALALLAIGAALGARRRAKRV